MIAGQKCKLWIEGAEYSAECLIGSDNLRSLILTADRGITVNGGIFAGQIPLLFDDNAGGYRDLLTGTLALLEWCDVEMQERASYLGLQNLKGTAAKNSLGEFIAAVPHTSNVHIRVELEPGADVKQVERQIRAGLSGADNARLELEFIAARARRHH